MAFDSLFTGISGINAYQNQIDMISNDIANTGTVGFKGQRMTFADLFYQTQAFSSAPTSSRGGINSQEVGVGVRVNSIDTNFAQGGLQTTGINTDLAVNGDGFFVLRNVDGSSGATYTRDGAFSLNSSGLLYDPASGLAVQGYTANSQGVIANSALGNITIPLGLQSQAVGTGFGNKLGPAGDKAFDIALGGNLDQTQWQVEEQGNITGKGAGQGVPDTISTTIYDSLGNAHQMFIKYVPDATGATAASQVSTANGNISGTSVAAGAAAQTITVTSNGPGLGYAISDANGNTIKGAAGATMTFDNATFTLASPEPAAATADTITITGATTGLPSSVTDAQGTAHTPATRWKTEAYFTDGTAVNGSTPTASNPTTLGYAYYDQNGQFINTSSSTGVNGAALATNVHTLGQPASIAAGDEINVTAWGLLNGNVAVAPTGSGAGPATAGAIGLDFSNTASLAGTSSASATASTSGYTATVLSQNGYEAGILSNISIGQDGAISGAFTNGQSRTLGQVALATFQNEDGLHRVGGNQFQESPNSGLAQVGTGNQGRFGAIIAGSLEQSNVSLADEFTKMIVAQRAFEANTRGISTADQNLQTVINVRASEN
ncbi:MAG: flagellar hook protein FlgE [Candidatus Baltobacteraceae bacterium]